MYVHKNQEVRLDNEFFFKVSLILNNKKCLLVDKRLLSK